MTDLHRLHCTYIFYKYGTYSVTHTKLILTVHVQMGADLDLLAKADINSVLHSGLHVILSAEWSKPHRH